MPHKPAEELDGVDSGRGYVILLLLLLTIIIIIKTFLLVKM